MTWNFQLEDKMHLYRHVSIIIKSKSGSNVILLPDKEITLPFHPTSYSVLALSCFCFFFCLPEILHISLRVFSHFERNKHGKHGESPLFFWKVLFSTLSAQVTALIKTTGKKKKAHPLFLAPHLSGHTFLRRVGQEERRASHASATLCCHWSALGHEVYLCVWEKDTA